VFEAGVNVSQEGKDEQLDRDVSEDESSSEVDAAFSLVFNVSGNSIS
jgi:hypothetical protein